MLTPYTTNAQVRAVFGVSEEELLDETLDLPVYEAHLRRELRAVGASAVAGSSILSDFTTAVALPDPTDVQKDFLDAVTLFAPYAVGQLLAQALPLFAAKAITDGKASVTRNSEAPFEKQISECKKNYEINRQALESAYAVFKNASVPADLVPGQALSISSPDTDPVTG